MEFQMLRTYLGERFARGDKHLTILAYCPGGKDNRRDIAQNIINLETGEYVCDHVCNTIRNKNVFFVADTEIYEYPHAGGYTEYGLHVIKVHTIAYPAIYGNSVVLLNSDAFYRFSNTAKYSSRCATWYDFTKYSISVTDRLFSVLGDGYVIEEETNDYYIFYYADKNSRIKAYKSLKAWIHYEKEKVDMSTFNSNSINIKKENTNMDDFNLETIDETNMKSKQSILNGIYAKLQSLNIKIDAVYDQGDKFCIKTAGSDMPTYYSSKTGEQLQLDTVECEIPDNLKPVYSLLVSRLSRDLPSSILLGCGPNGVHAPLKILDAIGIFNNFSNIADLYAVCKYFIAVYATSVPSSSKSDILKVLYEQPIRDFLSKSTHEQLQISEHAYYVPDYVLKCFGYCSLNYDKSETYNNLHKSELDNALREAEEKLAADTDVCISRKYINKILNTLKILHTNNSSSDKSVQSTSIFANFDLDE